AQRLRRGIEIVEAAGEKVRIDRCQLVARIAQVHRRIERHRMILPLRAQPALDLGHPIEEPSLEIAQRTGERGLQMRNHGRIVRQPEQVKKNGRRKAPDKPLRRNSVLKLRADGGLKTPARLLLTLLTSDTPIRRAS